MTNTRQASAARTRVTSTCGLIELDVGADRCTVRFEGEIDAGMSWDEVRRMADAVRAAARPVHVDCSAATFFCAEGLSMLALLKQAAPGGRLAALVASPAVELVLSVYPAGTYTAASAS